MLENYFTDEEETCDKRGAILQKYHRKMRQRGSFMENGSTKNTNQEETVEVSGKYNKEGVLEE